MPDTDVVPTMSARILNRQVHGKNRDKQLIVGLPDPDKPGEFVYIDVTGVSVNEDNVVLGTEYCPA